FQRLSSLLLPRPTRSTLFPYTTLFRSSAERRPAERERLVLLPRDRLSAHQGAARDRRHHGQGGRDDDQHRGDVADSRRRLAAAQDRKSTRLNSSHDQISYAVFCLKKKR